MPSLALFMFILLCCLLPLFLCHSYCLMCKYTSITMHNQYLLFFCNRHGPVLSDAGCTEVSAGSSRGKYLIGLTFFNFTNEESTSFTEKSPKVSFLHCVQLPFHVHSSLFACFLRFCVLFHSCCTCESVMVIICAGVPYFLYPY